MDHGEGASSTKPYTLNPTPLPLTLEPYTLKKVRREIGVAFGEFVFNANPYRDTSRIKKRHHP